VIRINLLGHEADKKSRGFSGFSFGEVSPNLNQIGIGAMFVLVILALALVGWSQARRLGQLRAEIAAIQAERARLEEIATEVETLQDRSDLARHKLEVIVELKASQTGPVMLLDQVSRALTDSLWLTRLELDGSSVSIRGAALSQVAVADFVNNLERSDYFASVRLRTLGDTGEARNFQVTLDFNPAPASRSGTEEGSDG